MDFALRLIAERWQRRERSGFAKRPIRHQPCAEAPVSGSDRSHQLTIGVERRGARGVDAELSDIQREPDTLGRDADALHSKRRVDVKFMQVVEKRIRPRELAVTQASASAEAKRFAHVQRRALDNAGNRRVRRDQLARRLDLPLRRAVRICRGRPHGRSELRHAREREAVGVGDENRLACRAGLDEKPVG